MRITSSSPDRMLTIIDIITRSEEYLKKYGVEQPRLNAELLTAHVLGRSRIELYLEYDKPLTEEEVSKMRVLLSERKARKPLQYIIGSTGFFGLNFNVGPEVLIPRPETELLVEEAIKFLKGKPGDKKIAYDIGTGSGCIAVSVAVNFPGCDIYASDPSPEALKNASANAGYNGVAGRITFLLGSYMKPFRDAGIAHADLVLANLPYVPSKDWDGLQPEVKGYEPKLALDGGTDGLDIIKRIVKESPEYMNPEGNLILEVGIGQSGKVIELIKETGKYRPARVRKDYNCIDRIVIAEQV